MSFAFAISASRGLPPLPQPVGRATGHLRLHLHEPMPEAPLPAGAEEDGDGRRVLHDRIGDSAAPSMTGSGIPPRGVAECLASWMLRPTDRGVGEVSCVEGMERGLVHGEKKEGYRRSTGEGFIPYMATFLVLGRG
jgi:hypothetical protein